MLQRLAVLVLASPGLDRVDLGGRVVENVRIDYGDEGEEGGGGCGADGDEGAQGRAVGKVDLLTVLVDKRYGGVGDLPLG